MRIITEHLRDAWDWFIVRDRHVVAANERRAAQTAVEVEPHHEVMLCG